MSWTCPHCETLNATEHANCEVCGAQRVAMPKWVCPNCETENPGEHDHCDVCGFDQEQALTLIEKEPVNPLDQFGALLGPAWRVPGTLKIRKKEIVFEAPKPAAGFWDAFKRLTPEKKKKRIKAWTIVLGLAALLWGPAGSFTWFMVIMGGLFLSYRMGLPFRKRFDEWLEEGSASSTRGMREEVREYEVWEDGHRSPVVSLVFNTEGDQLISVDENGNLQRWIAESGEKRKSASLVRGRFDKVIIGSSAAYVLDLDKLRVIRPDGSVRTEFALPEAGDKSPGAHTNRNSPMVLSREGQKVLAVGCTQGDIRLINTQNFSKNTLRMQPGIMVTSLAFVKDQSLIAAGNQKGTVSLFSLNNGNEIIQFRNEGQQVKSLCASKDGTLFAAGMSNGDIHVYAVASREEIRHFNINAGVEESGAAFVPQLMEFLPEKNWLVTVTQLGLVQVWDMNGETPQLVRLYAGTMEDIRSLAISPDGHLITVGSGDGSISVFDITKRDEAATAADDKLKGSLMEGESEKTRKRESADDTSGGDSKIERIEEIEEPYSADERERS